jgi:hypothetical protein
MGKSRIENKKGRFARELKSSLEKKRENQIRSEANSFRK